MYVILSFNELWKFQHNTPSELCERIQDNKNEMKSLISVLFFMRNSLIILITNYMSPLFKNSFNIHHVRILE